MSDPHAIPPDQPASPARRRVLLATSLLIGTLAVSGRLVQTVFADTPAQDAAFLQLSQLLTGRPQLDATIAHRFYSALGTKNSQLDSQIQEIAGEAQTNSLTNADELLAALDANKPELAKTARSIVAAWYSGVVGDGPDALVITYANALMFDLVKDATMPPSYCQAAPLYWSAKPPLA
ncbi:sugar dehydrogenase complex small subunit [Silvimonas amylolytica]|uniref:Dehydrogenase n=1 Tax=Silvimonas amylolytica TaxID=449663 RepID=A0ABQ2PLK4_9NEIS|nr:sugar dehydrogenase complex small subunit [Silvimonas amylolytica]GGP26139.1 dehydrogenase [Silvimonas amylolytica]